MKKYQIELSVVVHVEAPNEDAAFDVVHSGMLTDLLDDYDSDVVKVWAMISDSFELTEEEDE